MITKRLREQAADISALCSGDTYGYGSVTAACAALGLPEGGFARQLADEAWRHALRTFNSNHRDTVTVNAFAEAELRTGWTPPGWRNA